MHGPGVPLSDRHSVARDLAVDAAKALPVFGWFGALLSGMSVTDWASAVAILYTLLLILDKLKQWGVFRFLVRVWIRAMSGSNAGS